MIFAYPEMFVYSAKDKLGIAYEYATSTLRYSIDEFQDIFLSSGVDEEFEAGNVEIILGMSGYELVNYILRRSGSSTTVVCFNKIKPKAHMSTYYAGSSAALFQSYSGLSFKDIHKYLPMSYIETFVDGLLSDEEVVDILSKEMGRRKYKNNFNLLPLLFKNTYF